jgi:hypothetical protein
LESLVQPFSETEITDAFFQMNTFASPGPDGFGSSLYRKYWQLLKPKIFNLFNQLYAQSVDLSAINRAFLVLLSKHESANTTDAFRPISLQNCPVKALAKVLTNRLQTLISSLIHPDQTGFVKGRSIAENFNYAADILNCCHKRKVPSMLIKLDF